MRTYCYNLEDAEFVNSGGEKIPRCVPDLSYQATKILSQMDRNSKFSG